MMFVVELCSLNLNDKLTALHIFNVLFSLVFPTILALPPKKLKPKIKAGPPFSIIVNEINSAAERGRWDHEFVELKITDPCTQKRLSNGTHGPSLDGYYLFVLAGSSPNGKPIVDFAANLSGSFFKMNSSLFVVGQRNTEPDLPFESDWVVHLFKLKRKSNSTTLTPKIRHRRHHKDRINNGDVYPVAVVILYSKNHEAVRRKLWPTRNRNTLSNVGAKFLKKRALDMVVYGRQAPTDRCPVFEEINPHLEGKYYVLREYDHFLKGNLWEEPKDEQLDLSNQKCGTYAEVIEPFRFESFQLAPPTPGKENRCDGFQFIYETVVPGMAQIVSWLTTQNETFDIECNGTIPMKFYAGQYGSQFRRKDIYVMRNSLYYQSHYRSIEDHGRVPEVDWNWNVSEPCTTFEEMLDVMALIRDGEIREFLTEMFTNVSHYKPVFNISAADAVMWYMAQKNTCGNRSRPFGFGFGVTSSDQNWRNQSLSSSSMSEGVDAALSFAAGLGQGFWHFIAGLFSAVASGITPGSAPGLMSSITDGFFDNIFDKNNNVCPKCKEYDPEREEQESGETTTESPEDRAENGTIRNVTKEDDLRQKATDDDHECFFKRKENIQHDETVTSCGTTDLGQILVPLTELIKESPSEAEMHGASHNADLILARGAAKFIDDFDAEEMKEFIQSTFVCRKHVAEFAGAWERTAIRQYLRQRKGERGMKCAVPDIGKNPVAKPGHGTATVFARSRVSREQSKVVFQEMGTFIPIGLPMCLNHRSFIEDLVAAARVKEKNFCMSPAVAARSFAESPPIGRPFGTHGFATCSKEESSYWPVPPISEPSTPKDQQERDMRKSLTDFCNTGNIRRLHFTTSFSQLSERTKRERAWVVRAIVKSVCVLMAPDGSDEIETLAFQTTQKRLYQASPDAKIGKLLQAVANTFELAQTSAEKKQILSVVSPVTTYSEIVRYIPGLSFYYYKASRYYAKLHGPGRLTPTASVSRIRYDRKKVDSFISYITSPHVVFDLPFGVAKVRTTDGAVSEIPNLVRTMRNERTVEQYLSYLKQNNEENLAMSRSSLLRILRFCTAKHRKSLHGLDYFTFAGTEGFDTLVSAVERLGKLGQSDQFSNDLKAVLLQSKQYLKSDYKIHTKLQSRISDHCMSHALSDPNNALLHKKCNEHSHTTESSLFCDSCEQLKRALATVRDTVAATALYPNNQEKLETVYLVGKAIESINEWKAHNIRAMYQENVKTDILSQMNAQTVFITMDWAMKFIPTKGRETQTEFFGKRGISYHISVALIKAPGGDFLTRSFVHVYDQTRQDSKDIAAILRHMLEKIKQEVPRIDNAILRSDNAACYHSSPAIASVPDISEEAEIHVSRWSFSEPQAGKGPSDRMAAVIKRKVRMWVDENNPATTAAEFVQAACSYNGIKGVSFYIGTTEVPDAPKERSQSIPGILGYLDFQFSKNRQIRAWRFYGIGDGLIIPNRFWEGLRVAATFRQTHSAHQDQSFVEPTGSQVWKLLSKSNQQEQGQRADENQNGSGEEEEEGEELRNSNAAAENQKLFDCPVQGCIKKYQYYSNLQRHLESEKHKYVPERQTLRDVAIAMYKNRIERMAVADTRPELSDAIGGLENVAEEDQNPPLEKGWAIRQSKPSTVFTQNQRSYLVAKFLQGEGTRNKVDPKALEKEMRKEALPNGNLRFTPDEYLKWTQIASFFSRYAAIRRELTLAEAKKVQDAKTAGEASSEDGTVDAEVTTVYNDEYTKDPNFETVEEEVRDNVENSECFEQDSLPASWGKKRKAGRDGTNQRQQPPPKKTKP